MIIAIHQPQYLPWLGYFDKIEQSDVFVFLDNVQFKKNEWQNRNKIKTSEGWQWLSVPVIHSFGQKISDVEINNTVQWGRKHLNALATHYSKAPFFQNHIDFLEKTFSQEWKRLAEINIHLIHYLTEALGIKNKKFIIASDLTTKEGSSERLADICRQLNGDVYLSGRDGSKYLDLDLFKHESIQVVFQDYKHPRYPQLYGEFEPFLSVIDLLFNCGPESLSILKKGE